MILCIQQACFAPSRFIHSIAIINRQKPAMTTVNSAFLLVKGMRLWVKENISASPWYYIGSTSRLQSPVTTITTPIISNFTYVIGAEALLKALQFTYSRLICTYLIIYFTLITVSKKKKKKNQFNDSEKTSSEITFSVPSFHISKDFK